MPLRNIAHIYLTLTFLNNKVKLNCIYAIQFILHQHHIERDIRELHF